MQPASRRQIPPYLQTMEYHTMTLSSIGKLMTNVTNYNIFLKSSDITRCTLGRDAWWNYHGWKFHKFREFLKNISGPLFEVFIFEILYFNYNSPMTRKKCQSSLTTGMPVAGRAVKWYLAYIYFIFIMCKSTLQCRKKVHTVKLLKNFNVKISMKFSCQENFMKFTITNFGPQKAKNRTWVLMMMMMMMVICSAPFTYTVQIRTMVHYKS